MAEADPPPEDSGSSDLGDLARQYVDLWQQQLSKTASDEAMADMMAQTVQLMNAGAAAMTSMASTSASPEKAEGADHDDNTNGAHPNASTGAATTAASPGADEFTVHELARRIEQLEERIASLEAGTTLKST